MTMDTIAAQAAKSANIESAPVGRLWRMLIARFLAWQARTRSRQDLHDLTEDQLCDIGLTADQARRESKRSFMVRLGAQRLPPF